MLGHYSTRLSIVEINNTFYRMPKRELLEGWAGQVSTGFLFALKAPQRITHRERLEGSSESLSQFLEVASVLGEHVSARFSFSCRRSSEKRRPAPHRILSLFPEGLRAAFEFRHPSWFDGRSLRGASLEGRRPRRRRRRRSRQEPAARGDRSLRLSPAPRTRIYGVRSSPPGPSHRRGALGGRLRFPQTRGARVPSSPEGLARAFSDRP